MHKVNEFLDRDLSFGELLEWYKFIGSMNDSKFDVYFLRN